jgi:predicted ferric reductase
MPMSCLRLRHARVTLCRGLCRSVCLLCGAWSLAYIIWGNAPQGKGWYSSHAKEWTGEKKAGTPTIALTFPLIISACIGTLFWLEQEQPTSAIDMASLATTTSRWRRRKSCFGFLWNALSGWFTVGNSAVGGGDINFDRLALVFGLLPTLSCLGCITFRHLQSATSYQKQVMEVGNAFGTAAVIALSFWLIPVTKHSILLKIMDWNPIHAIRLHIWAGRCSTLGIVIHGTCHIYRWVGPLQENIWKLLFPPASCWHLWSSGTDADEPTFSCQSSRTDCDCAAFARNFTGLVAATALIVIALTSLSYVRRNHYRIFYICHISMGMLFIIMAIFHWSRTLMYILPSILYYTAATCPITVQALIKLWWDRGAKLTAVKCMIGDDNHKNRNSSSSSNQPIAVELCFEASPAAAAALALKPAQYARIWIPAISPMSWHPFTVVSCAKDDGTTIRILFRPTGPFTRALAQQCQMKLNVGTLLPKIIMDGFHSGPDRLAQALQHDGVVMIAGGIGITPYLSLLEMLYAVVKSDQEDNIDLLPTKKVTLHWICREECLINHVVDNYFEPMKQAGKDAGDIRIVIHHTSHQDADAADEEFNHTINNSNGMIELSSIRPQNLMPNQENGDGGSEFVIDDDDDEDDHEVEDDRARGTFLNSTANIINEEEIGEVDDDTNVDSNAIDYAKGKGQGGTAVVPALFSSSDAGICGNVPAFVVFTSISVMGLTTVWHMYQENHETGMSRIKPLVVVWTLGMIISLLALILVKSIQGRCYDVKHRFHGRQGIGSGHHLPLATMDHSNDNNSLSLSCEMTSTGTGKASGDETRRIITPATKGSVSIKRSIRIVHESGRPSIDSLLHQAVDLGNDASDVAPSIGVFACGPPTMMVDMRKSLQNGNATSTPSSQFALYEETFEA